MCLKIDTKYPKKNVAGKRNGDAIRVFLGYRFRKVSPINMAVAILEIAQAFQMARRF